MKLLALCILLAITPLADARSKAVRAHFQRLHPCPANGKKVGACPGYVVDHRRPLCSGGHDEPANMMWQTRKASTAKDKEELRLCRAIMRHEFGAEMADAELCRALEPWRWPLLTEAFCVVAR